MNSFELLQIAFPNIQRYILFPFRTNFIHLLRLYYHTLNLLPIHGSTYKLQNGNISKNMKKECRWRKKGDAKTNLW